MENNLRYFINQDGDANKFWQIEVDGKTFTATFGKIGTNGRETVKKFASEEECKKEADKLIAQKVKKGYNEIAMGSDIPEKVIVVDETPEGRFWEAIRKSNKKGNKNWKTYDIDEHLEALTKLLSKWDKQQLINFEMVMQKSLQQLFKASIAELDIILESPFKKEGDTIIFDDYLSDDGFIYFRCWLILKGKEFFDEILEDINNFNNGKYSFDIGDIWAEGLLYVTDEAYSAKHENKEESEIRDAVFVAFPGINYDGPNRTFDREPKGGAELQKMYPKLVNELVAIR